MWSGSGSGTRKRLLVENGYFEVIDWVDGGEVVFVVIVVVTDALADIGQWVLLA